MPWDATELRVAAAGAATETAAHELVAGSDGDTSVLQPAWHPTSGALFYVSDHTGFYELHRHAPGVRDDGSASTILAVDGADLGGSAPGWQLGQQAYCFLADGRVLATYPDRASGKTAVAVVPEAGGAPTVYSGEAAGLPHAVSGATPGLAADEVHRPSGTETRRRLSDAATMIETRRLVGLLRGRRARQAVGHLQVDRFYGSDVTSVVVQRDRGRGLHLDARARRVSDDVGRSALLPRGRFLRCIAATPRPRRR